MNNKEIEETKGKIVKEHLYITHVKILSLNPLSQSGISSMWLFTVAESIG